MEWKNRMEWGGVEWSGIELVSKKLTFLNMSKGK
jgi:hypothetical protein